jgi:hypothetical protein
MAVRDVFLLRIPNEEELEEFAAWAFGSDFRDLEHSIKFMEAWNSLHKDLLELKPEGILSEDASKMVKIWRENK